jgi:hypothetical protein
MKKPPVPTNQEKGAVQSDIISIPSLPRWIGIKGTSQRTFTYRGRCGDRTCDLTRVRRTL